MPNILLTDYCNRSCPYCFAREKIDAGHKQTNISLENIDYILDFLERSHHRVFSVLGGEPTLHPEFEKIIDKALNRQMQVKVFSNGLMKRKTMKYLFNNNIGVIININEPKDTPESHLEKLEQTYENLGPNLYPGFNIYNEDFDLSFIFDLIDRYYMSREIRLGLTQPIIGGDNKHIKPNSYRLIGKRLVEYAKQADKRNIRLNFDCGFVMCMFSKKEYSELVYANVNFSFLCGPTIDIAPDLTTWYCFPLSLIENKKLKDFTNLNEMHSYYDKFRKKYSKYGMFTKCNDCRFLARNQCTGGCIPHKMRLNKSTMLPAE